MENIEQRLQNIENMERLQILERKLRSVPQIVKCIANNKYLDEQIKLAISSNENLKHYIDIHDHNCYSLVHKPFRLEELWQLALDRNKYKKNPRVLQHFRGLQGEDVEVELTNSIYAHNSIDKRIKIDDTIRKNTDHGEDLRIGKFVVDTKYRHQSGRQLAIKDKKNIRADILILAEGECEMDQCICENLDITRTTTLKGWVFKDNFCMYSNEKKLSENQSPKWILPSHRLQDMNSLLRIALIEYITTISC